MIKYNNQEFTRFFSDLNFYDFQHFCSINGSDVKIEFSNCLECFTYNDLNHDSNREVFERKERMILELINSIFNLTKDENCLIKKYSESWIVNKKKSIRLYQILRNNNVKNKRTAAILVDKNNYEIELFVKSVLKYNSFVQFIFLEDKMVISVTDHMDIFISFTNKKFMLILQDSLEKFNSKYNKSKKICSIFNMVN